jgi:hypothetical protein
MVNKYLDKTNAHIRTRTHILNYFKYYNLFELMCVCMHRKYINKDKNKGNIK